MTYRSMPIALAVISMLACASDLAAQATTVFRGSPERKVTSVGTEAEVARLSPQEASNLQVVISRIGDRFYWASRENTEMARVEAGAFITFVALNGSGYVRFTKPDMRSAVSVMSPTEASYHYSEHILVGLRSVTYFGVSRDVP